MARFGYEKDNMTNSAWLKKIASQGAKGTYFETYKFYLTLKGTQDEPSAGV